jgi:hypothetical protein
MQNMIAVSAEAKSFVVALCEEFPARPGKGKNPYDLTQREAVDAIMEFVAANRIQTREESNEHGETALVEFDGLALEVERTLALRGAVARANSKAAENEKLKTELEELKAKLAALTGADASE